MHTRAPRGQIDPGFRLRVKGVKFEACLLGMLWEMVSLPILLDKVHVFTQSVMTKVKFDLS